MSQADLNEYLMPRNAEDEDKPKGEPKSGENLELKLLESRTILVEGPVTDKMFRAVVGRLLYLEQKDPKAEITMFVNSPGGSADSGFGIYDTMRFVSCPVRTICAGMCASAAVLIFLGGAKGKRFALPNSRILIHQPSGGMQGQATDVRIHAEELIRIRELTSQILSKHTGQDMDQIERDVERDRYLSAIQAKDYGLIDEVIAHRE